MGGLLACIAFILFVVFYSVRPKAQTSIKTQPIISTEAPSFTVETIASGLDHPWDVAFLPSGQLLVSQRSGNVSIMQNSALRRVASIDEVKVAGEGGLMGLAVDPKFSENRFIYTCYTTNSDVRVVRWRLTEDATSLAEKQPIVTGIFSGAGNRHQGCRVAFGPDDYLWIGTGDAATAGKNPQTPQDPKSLAGKIMRVDRDGKAASGNMGEPFDARIYSYGHRNVQGIVFLARPLGEIIGFSAEHGSTIDDEVNVLKKGNFGWDPDIAYTESAVSMTDKRKFPESIDATWSSGSPTQAPSGMAALKGDAWKAWNGALAVGMLKMQHLKILLLDENGKVVKEERIVTDKGRLRDVEQAPDGSLYITTDNGGGNDEILRLVPN
jgi:glucose/arabinose dehydrogenase